MYMYVYVVDVYAEKLTRRGVRGRCEGSHAGSPKVSDVERSESGIEGGRQGEAAGRR